MSITNPFSITYGGRQVGGSTGYQLHGPYIIDKSHQELRLVFEVVITAGSFSNLKSRSDTLEDDFSKRLTDGDTLVVNLGGSKWTYTHGRTILKTKASIQKSGDPEKDLPLSRAYTCSIEGELPASDDAGLRDIEVLTDLSSGRQKTVTMRGTYTASSSGDALAVYLSAFDAEAATYLTAIDSSAQSSGAFELVDESYTMDREKSGGTPTPHLCNFTRQYTEILANQSSASLNDAEIRDHRIVFTQMIQHPGDSRDNVNRLRRVIGTYECSIDIDVTTDLKTVYETKVKDHVKELFRTNFDPAVFAFEDQRVTYDETAKRLAAAVQFVYQPSSGGAILEMSQGLAYRENRTIDYTHTHGPDELAAEADLGFADVERVWTRTVIAVGEDTPKQRIGAKAKAGAAGLFTDTIGGVSAPDARDSKIVAAGWNVIQNTSQSVDRWIGDPEGEMIQAVVLTETIVERFNTKPVAGTRTRA
jgi:hypothetical protein